MDDRQFRLLISGFIALTGLLSVCFHGRGTKNRKSLLLLAAAVLAISSGLGYHLQAQPVESLLGVGAESLSGSVDLYQDSFDRETCERDCREAYGGWPGGSNDPRARLYARCIQDCERQFWQDYDRRMRNLEREKK
jgi:hypothetical protein